MPTEPSGGRRVFRSCGEPAADRGNCSVAIPLAGSARPLPNSPVRTARCDPGATAKPLVPAARGANFGEDLELVGRRPASRCPRDIGRLREIRKEHFPGELNARERDSGGAVFFGGLQLNRAGCIVVDRSGCTSDQLIGAEFVRREDKIAVRIIRDILRDTRRRGDRGTEGVGRQIQVLVRVQTAHCSLGDEGTV